MGRILRRSVTAMVSIALMAPSVGADQVEIEGPEQGWTRVLLEVGDARVSLEVVDEAADPGPAASFRFDGDALQVLVAADLDGTVDAPSLLEAKTTEGSLEVIPLGDPPGADAALEIRLRLAPASRVRVNGGRLELSAVGAWRLPSPPGPESEPPPKRARRRREQPPPPREELPPPAPAELTAAAASLSLTLDGWPGAVRIDAARAEVNGQDVGGAVRIGTGRGRVELVRVGGKVHLARDRGSVTLQEALGRVELELVDTDAWLSDCRGGVGVKSRGGQVVLEDIDLRSDVEVEEGTLEVSRLTGHLGGLLRWTDASLADVNGSLRLSTEEGTLRGRALVGVVNLKTARTEIDLEDVKGSVRLGASGAPVRVAKVSKGVQLTVAESEVTLEEIMQKLEVTQDGGTLTARGIGADPQLELTDVQLDYRHASRVPRGGSIRLEGGRARIRLPRQTSLGVAGDAHLVETTLTVNELEDDEGEPKPKLGRYLTLIVDRAEVEVVGYP